VITEADSIEYRLISGGAASSAAISSGKPERFIGISRSCGRRIAGHALGLKMACERLVTRPFLEDKDRIIREGARKLVCHAALFLPRGLRHGERRAYHLVAPLVANRRLSSDHDHPAHPFSGRCERARKSAAIPEDTGSARAFGCHTSVMR